MSGRATTLLSRRLLNAAAVLKFQSMMLIAPLVATFTIAAISGVQASGEPVVGDDKIGGLQVMLDARDFAC